jgi:hypothetical protein
MIYSLIDHQSGNEVAGFSSEREALDFALEYMRASDRWALFEFGPDPSENRLVAADGELRAVSERLWTYSSGSTTAAEITLAVSGASATTSPFVHLALTRWTEEPFLRRSGTNAVVEVAS